MKRPKLEDSKKIGNMSLAGVSIDYRKHLQVLNEYINFLENELIKLHQPTVSGTVCNFPCCKSVGTNEIKSSEFYCDEHFNQ
jgi:hypothetical protein